ncbi:MAG: DEAD/DEAH box helicase [Lentisphaerae bacterium]|jgi:superfamily II DNA or RNA helicase|nr:DEAD/DEAH box helicase [Lentisphaerota bacterium]
MELSTDILRDWGGDTVFRDSLSLLERVEVLDAEFDLPMLRGTLSWGTRSIKTAARVLPDMTCESLCPCRDNVERGVICPHVIVLGLTWLARRGDAGRGRVTSAKGRGDWRLAEGAEDALHLHVPPGTPGAREAVVVAGLTGNWRERAAAGRLSIEVALALDGAEAQPISETPPRTALGLSARQERLLTLLENAAEGPVPDALELEGEDAVAFLELHRGQALEADGGKLAVNAAPVSGGAQVSLDHASGELKVALETGDAELTRGAAGYLIHGQRGWLAGADGFWPLTQVAPEAWHELYRGPVVVPRTAVPRFLHEDLPRLRARLRVVTEVTEDLFHFDPEAPEFRLNVRGSPASLAMQLLAVYQDIEAPAGQELPRERFAHPDPGDILRYTIRDLSAERRALELLARFGVGGRHGGALAGMVGIREVLNFLGRAAPFLRRQGWRLAWSGRIGDWQRQAVFAQPQARIETDEADGSWFDVAFDYDDGEGGRISAVEIQRALERGDSFLRRGEQTILLDAEALEELHGLFRDCAAGEGRHPGGFRLPAIYTAYVASALQALEGASVRAPATWFETAARHNRLEELPAEPLPGEFDHLLRPYQREGVQWLRFLQRNGFGGILADEMGLGKTLQALVWLAMAHRGAAEGGGPARPSLIVCPTSLTENWIAEGARFTPGLRMVAMTGSERHRHLENLQEADVLVTSYALLRRDIERFAPLDFMAVVLDEAQHIKNRHTSNAQAAKRLKAAHRLVLTGTPIENGAGDLWSIMDFLMPGYMGGQEAFRRGIEQPIAQGGLARELAQWKLRRKLRPFLLRRMKKDVARELPPKIERVAACALSPDQQRVYGALIRDARRRITRLVAEQGFARAKFQILTMLLRLRQVCCHLDLLGNKELKARRPSAKMELFFELLDEALDAGHRVLVFSQFVSMLSILRQEIRRRGLRLCYLDGATQDRLSIVQRFNRDRSIPVFLISLKAGGTGLNLTGADMVIHYDPWWNPAVENQATDRAYRIGQERTVYSVKLIARNSIEERVLALQRKKQQLYHATLDDADGVADVRDLTWEDVQELITL